MANPWDGRSGSGNQPAPPCQNMALAPSRTRKNIMIRWKRRSLYRRYIVFLFVFCTKWSTERERFPAYRSRLENGEGEGDSSGQERKTTRHTTRHAGASRPGPASDALSLSRSRPPHREPSGSWCTGFYISMKASTALYHLSRSAIHSTQFVISSPGDRTLTP